RLGSSENFIDSGRLQAEARLTGTTIHDDASGFQPDACHPGQGLRCLRQERSVPDRFAPSGGNIRVGGNSEKRSTVEKVFAPRDRNRGGSKFEAQGYRAIAPRRRGDS